MLSKKFAIKKLLKFREKNKELVDKIYEESFSEKFTASSLSKRTKTEFYAFVESVEIKFCELESGININKLASSIHRGSSNSFSTQAFSERVCKSCGKKYVLSNGSKSILCLECATDLATNIVLDYRYFIKK